MWAEEWIFDVASRDQYLDKLGASRLTKLRSAAPWGYQLQSW